MDGTSSSACCPSRSYISAIRAAWPQLLPVHAGIDGKVVKLQVALL